LALVMMMVMVMVVMMVVAVVVVVDSGTTGRVGHQVVQAGGSRHGWNVAASSPFSVTWDESVEPRSKGSIVGVRRGGAQEVGRSRVVLRGIREALRVEPQGSGCELTCMFGSSIGRNVISLPNRPPRASRLLVALAWRQVSVSTMHSDPSSSATTAVSFTSLLSSPSSSSSPAKVVLATQTITA
jgi:hypothetical protein